MLLRPATAADRPGVIALIDSVFHEYGDRVWLVDADSDLLAVPEWYEQQGGMFCVLADGERVVGTVALVPAAGGNGAPATTGSLRRIYLHPECRGGGWGQRLFDHALAWAREQGYRRLVWWSDMRFTRAHQFFARQGARRGETRTMHDGATPYHEYAFELDLDG